MYRDFSDDISDSTLQPISDGKLWRPTRRFYDPTTTTLKNDVRRLIDVIRPPIVLSANLDPSGTGGVPFALLSVSATESPAKVQGGTVSQVSVSFTRRSDDSSFNGVRVWFKNYQGTPNPQLVASGSDSPVSFNVQTTDENVIVLVEPIGANGATAGLDFASSTTVLLDGVISAPPAPSIAQTLVATPTGYQFAFNQLPAQVADVIDNYRVYRNTTNDANSASLFKVVPHDAKNGAVVTVQDTEPYGISYFYFVSAVNTSALESVRTPAQSGAVSSDTVPKAFGKNLISNPGFEFNTVGTPLSTTLPQGAPVTDDWYVWFVDPTGYWSVSGENATGVSHTGSNYVQARLNIGISVPSDGHPYETRVTTRYKIPVTQGDVIRVKCYRRWDFTASLPAGITVVQRLGFMYFDVNDTYLGETDTDLTTTSGVYALQQVVQQVPATVGTGTPSYVRVQIGAYISNSSGATFSTGTNLYADLRFDDVSMVIQDSSFDNPPVNTAYTPTGGNPLSSSTGSTANHATVNIAATTLQYGDGQVNYNAGSITPLSDGTGYYIYADDSTYSGGAVTYQATTQNSVINAANGRIYFGSVTTPAFGGTGTAGTGGGSGACFSPDTRVVTERGTLEFFSIVAGDRVLTLSGWRKVNALLSHDYIGKMHVMPDGGLVTPGHHIHRDGNWVPASTLFADTTDYEGIVHNLSVDGDGSNETQCYTLGNGEVAHNEIKLPQ